MFVVRVVGPCCLASGPDRPVTTAKEPEKTRRRKAKTILKAPPKTTATQENKVGSYRPKVIRTLRAP